MFAIRTPDLNAITQVTISHAMFVIRTPDPDRIPEVTISYAMFDFPTASVDLRSLSEQMSTMAA